MNVIPQADGCAEHDSAHVDPCQLLRLSDVYTQEKGSCDHSQLPVFTFYSVVWTSL